MVEAVVGDFQDGFDVDEREPAIRRRSDGSYDVDGGVPLSVVNDALDTRFESDEVETIGGLVLSRLDRAPEVGDSIEVDAYVIEVTDIDGARIVTVEISGDTQRENGDESGPDTGDGVSED